MSLATPDLTTELDRMDDDGSPPDHMPSTPPHAAHARPTGWSADLNHAVVGASVIGDRYRQLGSSRRKRDASALRIANAGRERDDAKQRDCERRWPAMVAAMRTLISCYNDGAGREALTLVDQRTGSGELAATVTALSGEIIVLAVDEADLWVRAGTDGQSRAQRERWIGLGRTDEATADYVLHDWLTQLEV